MREIVLDIESTGFRTDEGHRMVEIGMVELKDGKATGKTFHAYFNPDRDMPKEAFDVHGLSSDFLSKQPIFAESAEDIRNFIGDSAIIITCWDMDGYVLDVEFLKDELERVGVKPPKAEQWINVRKWSEEMYGHKKASLNLILDRFKVDRTERDDKGHGALLDAQLLAEVYPKLKPAWFEYIQKKPVSFLPKPNSNKKPGL